MFSLKHYPLILSLPFWLCFSPHSLAEPVDGWQLSIAAGQGQTSTPLAGRRSISGNVIPGVSYYGERFYLENSHIGFSLLENDHVYVDVVGELNDDGLFFELDGVNKFGWWDALGIDLSDLDPMAANASYADIERNLSYMAGISGNVVIADTTFRLTLLQDISGVHHGETQRLSLKHQLVLWQNLRLQLNVATEHKDAQLINYYYNLRPKELNNTPSWFHLPAVWNVSYGISANYQLNDCWSVLAHWQRQQLDSDLLLSPLLARRDFQSKFVGVRYIF